MNRNSPASLSCALLVIGLTSNFSCANDVSEGFDRDLRRLMRLLDVPGLAVAVVKDGEPIFRETYGWADISSQKPMTADTLIEIASVTKTMTSIVVGQLIDEGTISLDDRVIQYPFANWFKPSRIRADVTLRHVLSHTSQGRPLGATYLYQGNRFNFVWGVFGTATADSYQDALSKRILQPVGMSDSFPQTGVDFTDGHRSRVATPYRYEQSTDGPLAVDSPPSPDSIQVVPAAGLFSTLNDMIKYAIALESQQLVDQDTWAAIQTPTQSSEDTSLPYAIGWAVQRFRDEKLVWHYGFGNGNSALLVRVPAKKLAFILMANSGNVSGSTRWGYGDLLNSPFATGFVRHFLLAKSEMGETIDFDGDLDLIDRTIAAQLKDDADTFHLREMFAEATIRTLMEGGKRDTTRAAELLVILERHAPEMLRRRGLTALDVLSRIDDKRLEAAHMEISKRLLQRYPSHPIILLQSGRLQREHKNLELAKSLIQRAADSTDFEDETYTVDACLELGKLLLDDEPEQARRYFWRAVTLADRIPANLSNQVESATNYLYGLENQ